MGAGYKTYKADLKHFGLSESDEESKKLKYGRDEKESLAIMQSLLKAAKRLEAGEKSRKVLTKVMPGHRGWCTLVLSLFNEKTKVFMEASCQDLRMCTMTDGRYHMHVSFRAIKEGDEYHLYATGVASGAYGVSLEDFREFMGGRKKSKVYVPS